MGKAIFFNWDARKMILLEFNNRILLELIEQRFASEKRELLDVTFADFDGVSFHVTSTNEQRNLVKVSMAWSCCQQLLKLGGQQDLQKIYGPMLSQPEAGYDVTLVVDLDSPPEDPKNLPMKISNLKRHVFAAPFKNVFGQIVNKSAGSDAVFAKVFLQEFADARKSMRSDPGVKFTLHEAPLELEGYPGLQNVESNGFVSMALFDQHLNPKNVYKTINLVETFRDYLHYHIKCSKAYMHNRMRARVATWLQVLNRARPDPIAEKAKKVASGRTFTRK